MKYIIFLILILSTSFTSCSQNGITIYDSGVELMNNGKYEEARAVFSKGIDINDVAISANYFGRAYSNYELKNYNASKADIIKSLETENLNSENINSGNYWLKGMIAEFENDKPLEIKSYRKALEYVPEDNDLKTTLALALIEINEFDEAINILTNVIQLNSDAPYALNNRALAYIKVGKLNLAINDLDNSKKLDEENPFLFENYFYYYLEMNDMEKACKSIEEALNKRISDYGDQIDMERMIKLKEESCT